MSNVISTEEVAVVRKGAAVVREVATADGAILGVQVVEPDRVERFTRSTVVSGGLVTNVVTPVDRTIGDVPEGVDRVETIRR